ncbi:MAG: hemolysin family protein [Gammaproteobacteria bacterium]
MDGAVINSIITIVGATVILALAAGLEAAVAKMNLTRLSAQAEIGNLKAARVIKIMEPAAFRSFAAARALAGAGIIAAAAYFGAREFNASGAAAIAVAGGAFSAMIQITAATLGNLAPEETVLRFSWTIRWCALLFIWPARILSLPSRLLSGSIQVGTPSQRERDGEDLVTFLEKEEATGGVEEEERRMIRGVIELEEKAVHEIMAPRIDIVATERNSTVREVAQLATERGFSRIPVFEENIDNIIGIVYAKDLLAALVSDDEETLDKWLRNPVFVPESKRADDLLTEMRGTRTHLAIAVDEYGGTAGLVTIEDLLEEIVGEIEDEYDVAAPAMEVLSANEVLLDAGMATDVLEDLFSYMVESEDFDTVGGFLIHLLGRLPRVGDEVSVDGLQIKVLSMSGRRLQRLRIIKSQESDENDDVGNTGEL